MNKIMRRLQSDHRNTAHVLDLLAREFEVVARGEGQPNYDLLRAVLDYLRSYPDLGHHPMEDVVYRQLCRRDASAGKRFAELIDEHAKLSALTVDLAEEVESVFAGAPVSRAVLASMGRDFVTRYREHMHREDTEFFPAALKHLDFEDWGTVEADFDAPNDPLFGPQAQARFERLRAEIEELSVQPG